MSSVTMAGPLRVAPSVAWRAAVDCRIKPSSTSLPTRNGRAGLPSMEISAAPPPGEPATTPWRANRLAELTCGVVVGVAAPSTRATASGSMEAGLADVTGAGPATPRAEASRSPQYTRLAAASAQTSSVMVRKPSLLCESVATQRL